MNIELRPGQSLQQYVDEQIELKMYELLLANLRIDIQPDNWSHKRWEVNVSYDNKLITSDSFAI